MKKSIAIVLSIVLLCSFMSFTTAAADNETAIETVEISTSNPLQTEKSSNKDVETDIAGNPTKVTYVGMEGIKVISDWESNGYPDDIGSVTCWQEGYNPSLGKTELNTYYIIYVVKGTSDARKAELKTLMGSDYVEFRECTISRNKQYEYCLELNEALGKYVYRIAPTADVNDLRIIFYFPAENHSVIKEYLMENYADLDYLFILESGVNPADLDGDKSVPEIATGIVPTVGVATAVTANETRWVLYAVIIAVSLVISAASYMVFRKVYSRTLALSNGDTVSDGRKPTKKEVEEKIEQSTASPSEKVIDNIYKKM